jgi:hypothetical protein
MGSIRDSLDFVQTPLVLGDNLPRQAIYTRLEIDQDVVHINVQSLHGGMISYPIQNSKTRSLSNRLAVPMSERQANALSSLTIERSEGLAAAGAAKRIAVEDGIGGSFSIPRPASSRPLWSGARSD